MKNLILLAFLVTSSFCYSQEIKLDDKDGISVTYKLTKIKEEEKKDTYLIVCTAKNSTDQDLFYEAPENKVNPFFSTITVRNNSSYLNLIGLESKLSFGGIVFFYIKKGSSVSTEKELKFQKGITPILTNEFVSEIKPISEFR
jgi:hypothetical protein